MNNWRNILNCGIERFYTQSAEIKIKYRMKEAIEIRIAPCTVIRI